MPLKKKLLEREASRVQLEVQRDQLEKAMCARQKPCREAVVEDEYVDVVGGCDEVGVSGYDFDGFTLSEIFRRKRLAKKSVFSGVVDTAHLPYCEFSNLQYLPITSLLEIFRWPVIEFCQANCAARAET